MDIRKILPQKAVVTPHPDISSEKEEAHVHQWDLVAKTFIEPKPITVQGSQEISKLLFTGQTTYLFQCSLCSEFRKEVCEGLETTALDRLLDKVDLTGPEYIVRDKGTYVLMKYQTEQAQLPVR